MPPDAWNGRPAVAPCRGAHDRRSARAAARAARRQGAVTRARDAWWRCTTIRSTGAAGRQRRRRRACGPRGRQPRSTARRCVSTSGGAAGDRARCWPAPCASPRSPAGCSAVWRTSPLQALARLHVLAAADLVPAERHDAELGRPHTGRGVSARLGLLADMLTGGTSVPGPCWSPWCTASCWRSPLSPPPNGVVARAAARLTAVAAGLDPKGLAVPEVGHLRHAPEYRTAAAAFAGGPPRASRHGCCTVVRSGRPEPARECRSPTPGPDHGPGPRAKKRAAPLGRDTARLRANIRIQACTTCRGSGLGVQRPGPQAHDDMPPAACCAWSARPLRTEPRSGRTGASPPHRPWPTRSPCALCST